MTIDRRKAQTTEPMQIAKMMKPAHSGFETFHDKRNLGQHSCRYGIACCLPLHAAQLGPMSIGRNNHASTACSADSKRCAGQTNPWTSPFARSDMLVKGSAV